jgi:two-component system chemotaxis response regulator CheB
LQERRLLRLQLPSSHLVVIGASAGGVTALTELAARLPAGFAAPVCVVLHIGAHPSMLPELLRRSGPLNAVHARHGQALAAGTIYVAPPDWHMEVDAASVLLHRGAKENHARPAIDPLFRSAALHWRERAIGVVLSGLLDDGAAGLCAIQDCGGLALVQDPATADAPDMPINALNAIGAPGSSAGFTIPALVAELLRVVGTPARSASADVPPERLVHEQSVLHGDDAMTHLSAIADPSPFTCPECSGSLWQLREGRPVRFRCHTGHAFSVDSLAHNQATATDEALWTAMRALQERELLLRRVAAAAAGQGDERSAAMGRAEADKLQAHVRQIARIVAPAQERERLGDA